MRYQLIKQFEGIGFYGDVPDPFPYEDGPLSENIHFSNYEKLLPLFNEDYIDAVWELTGVPLDIGDVAYYDTTASSLLAGWLEYRLACPIDPDLANAYRLLLDYAKRAIQLGTGIVVEL